MSEPTPYITIGVLLDNGNIPKEMLDWLSEHVGPVIDDSDHLLNICGEGWDAWGLRISFGTSQVIFHFKDVRKATLFKLRWG